MSALYPITVDHPGQPNDLFPWVKEVGGLLRDHLRDPSGDVLKGNMLGVTSSFIQRVMNAAFDGNAAALAVAAEYVTIREPTA